MTELAQSSPTILPSRTRAYERLKAAITDGTLAPGERLIETTLAERFGMSRTPVREALRALQADGLVEGTPSRGVVVTTLKMTDVIEIYRIRQALEALAFQTACEHITEAQLADVRQCLSDSRHHLAEGDVRAFFDDNERFTDLVVAASALPRVIALIATYREQLRRFRRTTLSVRSRQNDVVSEHSAILAAIEARDQALTGRLVTAHLEHALAAYWRYPGLTTIEN